MDPTPSQGDLVGAHAPILRRKAKVPRIPALTERDGDILRWITRHGVVTPELVGRRFFWRPEHASYGKWAAYRRLRALRDLGLVVAMRPIGLPTDVLRVTPTGARLADVGLEPATVVLAELHHTLCVVWLGEYLLAHHPGSDLTTERELWAERYRQRYIEGSSSDLGRIPDAILRLPANAGGERKVVAIELDLSRKERRVLETMIARYDHTPVDAVWWYVTPTRVARIQALVAELGATDRFAVMPWWG